MAARREDFSYLTPAWIGVRICDLFLDEGRDYAQRLSEFHVDVTYVKVDGAIHGFDIAQTDMGRAFNASQGEFIQR